MIKVLNNWFVKYLVIFVFIYAILFGFFRFIYPPAKEQFFYTQYSVGDSHYFVKIDKKTGDIYRFSSALSKRVWEKLNN